MKDVVKGKGKHRNNYTGNIIKWRQGKDGEPLVKPDPSGRVYCGLMAEDVAEHLPGAEFIGHNDLIEDYDRNHVIAALVYTVQQLKAELDESKQQIELLKSA